MDHYGPNAVCWRRVVHRSNSATAVSQPMADHRRRATSDPSAPQGGDHVTTNGVGESVAHAVQSLQHLAMSLGQLGHMTPSTSISSILESPQKETTGRKRTTSDPTTNPHDMSSYRVHSMHQQLENTVCLNIGGTRFTTSLTTLLRVPGTLFTVMFDSKFGAAADSSGCYFIDRDPTHFRHILNYLRDGNAYMNSAYISESIVDELLLEASFYQVQPFVKFLKRKRQALLDVSKREQSNEKEYKIVHVPTEEVQETLQRLIIVGPYDFEGWIQLECGETSILMSKKLSKGDVEFIDQLLMG